MHNLQMSHVSFSLSYHNVLYYHDNMPQLGLYSQGMEGFS